MQRSAHNDESDMDVDALDAAKYENHNGDIIAILLGLLGKAQGQLDSCMSRIYYRSSPSFPAVLVSGAQPAYISS